MTDFTPRLPQQEILRYTRGKMGISAVPGSGKTHTLSALAVGSSGWWERLSQPLTQPYMFSRAWMQGKPGRLWTDADKQAAHRDTLRRLASGPLLKAVWKMQLQAQGENNEKQE
jgi:hypothetical protein